MKSWFTRRRKMDLGRSPGEGEGSIEIDGNVVRESSSPDLGATEKVPRPRLRLVPGRSAGSSGSSGSSGDSAPPGGWARAEVLPIEIRGIVQIETTGAREARRGFLRAFIQGAVLITCVFGTVLAEDGSLWDEREGFRYTNRKAMQVGDLITVLVTESSSGSNRSSLSTSKEHKVNLEGGPGAGPLDFIPLFGLDSNTKNELSGSGQVSVSGQLSTTLTVEVREIRPNGYLVVEGSRLIDLNGEQEQVTLHGVARPEDIRSDNTVPSSKLSEMRIEYAGKGAGKSASRPGIFARILGWIF